MGSAACRCPPRSSQPHLGYTSLPAPQLTAAPRLHVAARPAAHSCTSRLHVAARLAAHQQLTSSYRLHVVARPAAHSRTSATRRCPPRSSPAALSCMSLAPAAHSRISATRCCPPRSSQSHLGYTSLPAPQLTNMSLPPAAHSRISATRRCPPRSSQPHLGYTSLPAPQLTPAALSCMSLPAPQLTAAVAARPAAHSRILAAPCCPPRSSPEGYGCSCASCGFLSFLLHVRICLFRRSPGDGFFAASDAVCRF